jgi:hypothetical protein
MSAGVLKNNSVRNELRVLPIFAAHPSRAYPTANRRIGSVRNTIKTGTGDQTASLFASFPSFSFK